jgi:phage-related baseplate assembly protein
MAGGFTAVDLSQLPKPAVVETLDYETILAELKAQLTALDATLAPVLALESEPLTKIVEVCAYRELNLRQRINESAQAVMLAYARQSDLDNLGALMNVARLQTDPGDPNAIPPVPPSFESDADYRRRIQLSPEGFSTAGPEGAYVFHALSASGDVLDASAISPNPGEVLVSILSRTGDGTADQALIDTVLAVLSADDVRPLTDQVIVQSAAIINYQITATLYFYAGPGKDEVLAAAQAAAEAYAQKQHRLGLDVTLSGIYAALHQSGVQRVALTSPAADIVIDRQSASYCTAIALSDGGLDE